VREQPNADPATVDGFGAEWSAFDQTVLAPREREELFTEYFGLFPWDALPAGARGADIGCGSGRWAQLVAPRVGHLTCVDASEEALDVARQALGEGGNTGFVLASVGELPFADGSLDFAYSLGVLHHVPDTRAALAACARTLKPGAPFLVYLYYALDGRPRWFRLLWTTSDRLRRLLSRRSHRVKFAASTAIALLVYLPLARFAAVVERLGGDPAGLPLSYYRRRSLLTMRTDAYDRFGTRLEQRFTREQIASMLSDAGFDDVQFSEQAPFWCAVARRRAG
jgi:SAM-dependent methyltransferase